MTEHRTEDGQQITTKIVEDTDGTTVGFSGPVGGPYEYDGAGEPPEWALVALYDHVDEDEIGHDRPDREVGGGEE